MQNAVTVALKSSADWAGRFFPFPAPALGTKGSLRAKDLSLTLLQELTNFKRHITREGLETTTEPVEA